MFLLLADAPGDIRFIFYMHANRFYIIETLYNKIKKMKTDL